MNSHVLFMIHFFVGNFVACYEHMLSCIRIGWKVSFCIAFLHFGMFFIIFVTLLLLAFGVYRIISDNCILSCNIMNYFEKNSESKSIALSNILSNKYHSYSFSTFSLSI